MPRKGDGSSDLPPCAAESGTVELRGFSRLVLLETWGAVKASDTEVGRQSCRCLRVEAVRGIQLHKPCWNLHRPFRFVFPQLAGQPVLEFARFLAMQSSVLLQEELSRSLADTCGTKGAFPAEGAAQLVAILIVQQQQ